jgi:hypothetical protein
MSSITNLEGLFAVAAADWAFNPPPAIRGGGTAPQVASRMISVVATFTATDDGIVYLPQGDPFPVTLYYTPSRRVLVKGVSLFLPAGFSGNLSGGLLYISMSASAAAEDGFGVAIDVNAPEATTLSYTVPPPGGNQGNGADPLVNISFAGVAVGDGQIELFSMLVDQYSFVLTLR